MAKTRYNPAIHHRRSIRLPGYDYTRPGAYFVTLCVQDRRCVLGEIRRGAMVFSEWGRIVAQTWTWLRDQYPYVALDVWVVMPNHFHGIIVLTDDVRGMGASVAGVGTSVAGVGAFFARVGASVVDVGASVAGVGASVVDVGARRDAPLRYDAPQPDAPPIKRKPLGQLIGAFKTVSTKHINAMQGTPGTRFWQRDYYEHIVRDERDLERIRRYIINNPRRWQEDRDNLTNIRRLPPPSVVEDYLRDMEGYAEDGEER